jgi:hypothetical protein
MEQVRVRGLDDFRRELKKVDKALGKELRQVHLKVARLVADRAQRAAPGRTAKAISAAATQKVAAVRITPKRGDELGVFMGMKRRSGWYAKGRYRASTGRQFRPWVGANWDPGDGGGPYYIAPAINRSIDDVIDLYGDEIEKLAAKAFPE